MLYRDIENKLDMQFEISARFAEPLVRLIEKEDQIVPVFLSEDLGGLTLDLFLNPEIANRLGGAIVSFKPVRKGDYLIVRISTKKIEDALRVSNGLANISSSCLSAVYARRGRLYLKTFFHSAEIKEASNLLAKGLTEVPDARIEYLGTSNGRIRSLEETNSVLKLCSIMFEINPPPGSPYYTEKDYYADISPQYLRLKEFNAVVFPDDPVGWKGVTPTISDSDGIYSTRVQGLLTEGLFELTTEQHIPVNACIIRGYGRSIRVCLFIPTLFKQDFLKTLFGSLPNTRQLALKLLAVRDYDPSVWEWI